MTAENTPIGLRVVARTVPIPDGPYVSRDSVTIVREFVPVARLPRTERVNGQTNWDRRFLKEGGRVGGARVIALENLSKGMR